MIGVDIKLIKVFKAADANFKFHTFVLVWCQQRLFLSEAYINVAFSILFEYTQKQLEVK